jgi:hypothetical protein
MKAPPDPSITVAAIAGLAACVGDVVIPAILGRMVPGYDSTREVLSRLGCADSPVRMWINAWWCLFGLLIAVFAWGFFRAFAGGEFLSWPGLAALLLLVFGLGSGPGAGLFPMDIPGTPPTRSGAMHQLLPGLGFIALFFLPAVGLAIFSGGKSPILFWLSAAALVGGVAGAVLISISGRPGASGILALGGFWQRAFLANYYVYLIALAAVMLTAGSARSSPP